jgi:hypothetical protein
MDRKTWTRDDMAAFVATHGLPNASSEEIEHMAKLAARVTDTGARIPRMPSKDHEPANTFKVPQ